MIDLNDPEMQELVAEFCNESDDLLEELRDILDNFEDDPSEAKLLENFGQTIDRIMGAAQTLGDFHIGDLCQMGKIIGYKASQSDQQALKEVTAGVLFDLCDFLEVLLVNLREGKENSDLNYEAFQNRLRWLAEKFKDIDRASCDISDAKTQKPKAPRGRDTKTTAELEKLIAQFGKAS
jgi:chemotaxis protein histidine kinase CheA